MTKQNGMSDLAQILIFRESSLKIRAVNGKAGLVQDFLSRLYGLPQKITDFLNDRQVNQASDDLVSVGFERLQVHASTLS